MSNGGYDLARVYETLLEQMREVGILDAYVRMPAWPAAGEMTMRQWLTAVLDDVVARAGR